MSSNRFVITDNTSCTAICASRNRRDRDSAKNRQHKCNLRGWRAPSVSGSKAASGRTRNLARSTCSHDTNQTANEPTVINAHDVGPAFARLRNQRNDPALDHVVKAGHALWTIGIGRQRAEDKSGAQQSARHAVHLIGIVAAVSTELVGLAVVAGDQRAQVRIGLAQRAAVDRIAKRRRRQRARGDVETPVPELTGPQRDIVGVRRRNGTRSTRKRNERTRARTPCR